MATKKILDVGLNKPRFLTGFTLLDILSGKNHIVDKSKPDEYFKVRGVPSGCSINFLGRSNIGKSLLADNIAGNIVRPFPQSKIYQFDTEGSSDLSRFTAVTGIKSDEIGDKMVYIPRSEATLERWFELYNEIVDEKLKDPTKYMVKATCSDGVVRDVMCPTVLLTDSYTTLRSEADREKEELNNMDGASLAKQRGKYIEKARDKAALANVMLFGILQEYENIQIGNMPEVRNQRGYTGNKVASGGNKIAFEADITLRFHKYVAANTESAETKFKCGKDIEAIIEVNIAKSRLGSSSDKVKFHLVQDRLIGFDPLLSLLYELINNTDIFEKPSPGRYKLKDDDKALYIRDIVEAVQKSTEYKMKLAKAIEAYYHQFIYYYDTDDILTNTMNLLNDLL